MDDRDIAEIRTRMIGLGRLTLKIDALSAAYERGAIAIIEGESVPLSSAQKSAIKSRVKDLLLRAEAVASTIDGPSGVIGTVDLNAVATVPSSNALEYMRSKIDALGPLTEQLELQPDGTMRVMFTAADAQVIANIAVTAGRIVRGLWGQFASRVQSPAIQ